MTTIRWAVPSNPIEDTDPDDTADAEHATVITNPFLTPFGVGNVPTPLSAPRHFITGSVYTASGHLVTASQRVGGFGGDQYIASDLPTITPRRVVSTLERFNPGHD